MPEEQHPDVSPVETGDGSHTLFSTRFNEHYHSIHGAVQESQHVFIAAGLRPLLAANPTSTRPLRVFEMGFGTGLNALLTALEPSERPIDYLSVEAYPLGPEQWPALNFCDQLSDPACAAYLRALHEAPWGQQVAITPRFVLQKHAQPLATFQPQGTIDLIYWDAFAPTVQPELWTAEVCRQLYAWLSPGGVWVSYSAKGDVRRALQAAGFVAERIPGPPGKRQMLRARKD
jgi:tRNA U34 5-methylaminomethyl-2-thiouridine-forming methyltransferase MnmC